MVNKTYTVLWLIVISLAGLACASPESADNVVATLDRAAWPTPVANNGAITPTPFPVVDQALVESIQAKAEAKRNGSRLDQVRADNPEESAEETADVLPPTATPNPQPANLPTEDDAATTQTNPAENASSIETAVTAATAAETTAGTVASFGLNLREQPNLEAPILAQLKQGDEVNILARAEGSPWVNVRTDRGVAGWVNSKYLNLAEASLAQAPNAPITQPAPASSANRAAESGKVDSGSTGERLLVQRQSGGDIVILNRDGSDLRLLTGGIDPVLSPDGRKVAFTRWGGDDVGAIWVANTDGSGESRIVGNLKQVKSPSWSPDSRQIAFNFQDGGNTEDVKKCKRLSEGQPDINFWIAYDVELEFNEFGVPVRLCWKLPPDPHWKLRVIDLETGEIRDLPTGLYAFAPTWDPIDPNRVVSVNGYGLVQTNVAAGTATELTTDSADRGPVFSPDGKHLAVTYKQHDHWEVHRLNADGSGRVRLTKTPLYAIVDGPQQWNNASPIFSPDSSEIAFLTDRTGRWEVWVMNLDGSNQRPMFSDDLQAQLAIRYDGNDARMLGWGR